MNLRGFLLRVAVAIPLISAAEAQEAALCGGNPTPVRIVEVIDANTFKLDDGQTIRLSNVIAPQPIDGESESVTHTRKRLGEIVSGIDAVIFLSSKAKDRYGRISVQAVVIDGGRWLEAILLERGLARVFLAASDKCAKALLRYEAKARDAGSGIWKDDKFKVFSAEEIEALLAAEGRFVVVEGVIRRVGEARGRLYLDFGRRFTEDFTIVVPDTTRKALAAQGSDPKGWRGKRVRVRGIILSWGGPAIELNLAQAIELLD